MFWGLKIGFQVLAGVFRGLIDFLVGSFMTMVNMQVLGSTARG